MGMQTMLQLNPPIPLETPKGQGLAHVLVDYGMEFDFVWVVFLREDGTCWSFRNSQVKIIENYTMGRIFTPPTSS